MRFITCHWNPQPLYKECDSDSWYKCLKMETVNLVVNIAEMQKRTLGVTFSSTGRRKVSSRIQLEIEDRQDRPEREEGFVSFVPKKVLEAQRIDPTMSPTTSDRSVRRSGHEKTSRRVEPVDFGRPDRPKPERVAARPELSLVDIIGRDV